MPTRPLSFFARLGHPVRHAALLTRRERGLLAGFAVLLLAGLFGPPLSYQAGLVFADARIWHGVPNAMDVVSNLPFAVLGVWGLWAVWRGPADVGARPDLGLATLFFIGLLVTALCSSFYHLHPDILRLAGDRAGMTVAFAGLIGLAVAERISRRAGPPAAAALLLAGLAGACLPLLTGNVLPWALLQFGGMAVVLLLALVAPVPGRMMPLRLGWVIAFYAAAKLFELGDAWVYEASGHVVSGHSLKHVIAALAGLPVIAAVMALRHNPFVAAVVVAALPTVPTGQGQRCPMPSECER